MFISMRHLASLCLGTSLLAGALPVRAQMPQDMGLPTQGSPALGSSSAGVAKKPSIGTITPSTSGRIFPASGDLLIGVGDGLNVSVFGAPDLSADARVDAKGDITLPIVGSVHVGDRTPADVATLLEKELSDRGIMNQPNVVVTISDYIAQGVSIEGEVKSPGIYPVIGSRSLADILAVVSGFTEMSNHRIQIQHAGQTTTAQVVDLGPAGPFSDVARSYKVLPGDNIIAERSTLIYVVGNVNRPGAYPLIEPITVVKAIALAQGLSPLTSLKVTTILRNTANGQVMISAPLDDVLKGHRQDLYLQAGDILYIHPSMVKASLKRISDAAVAMAASLLYYLR
jgi:polysaccharide biosynthesis/export protein